MITTTITNAGDPFVDGTGVPIVGADISFTMVNAKGIKTDGWDALTGERIAPGPITVQTDVNGVFTVDLWPTSRADQVLFWNCSTAIENVTEFFNTLIEGEPIPWLTFRYGTVDPFQVQSLLWLQIKALLVSSGYEFIGDYANGPLTIIRINQVFSKDGEYWRPLTTLPLPYETTGVWATEGASFVNIGDLMLRQDLREVSGAGLSGYDSLEAYPSGSVGSGMNLLRTAGSELVAYDPLETYTPGSIGAEVSQLRLDLIGGSALIDYSSTGDYPAGSIGLALQNAEVHRRFANGGETIDMNGLSAVIAGKSNDSASAVTVTDTSGKLINGSEEYLIYGHRETARFILNEDNTEWWIA